MKTLTLTISQFNTFVKNIFDAEEFLHGISIFGEVTNLKISGGNAYFDLKDQNAMLSCVKFGAGDLSLKNGDLVTVFGRVNFYVKSGRLNFVVARAEAYGLGELYQKFLRLKETLKQEGLFREEIKKAIPKFSKKLGVVTSETGAVIRDIINVTRSKNPFTDIVVYPSKVQGVGAEKEIATGIEYFNTRDDIDVIIVARGGGSFEDLAPFNTEIIARAIFESEKPIISAVGHETDFTICDFAADLRVPTPSVAAEVAVFDYFETKNRILQNCQYNYNLITNKINNLKQEMVRYNDLISKLVKLKSHKYVSLLQSNLLKISEFISANFLEKKNKTIVLAEVISKLNPIEILKSGYAIVETNGKKISSIENLEVGDDVDIKLSDGSVIAKVISKEKTGERLWNLKNH